MAYKPKEEECKVPKQQRWILVKEATVRMYKSGTDNSEVLSRTWRNNNNVQQQYDEWESCIQNILYNTCITRTKKPLASGQNKNIRMKNKIKQIWKMKKRRDNRKEGILNNELIEVYIRKLQKEVSQVIDAMQQKELKEKNNSIKQTGGPASNQIWKIRKAMKTKRSDKGHTVKDSVTGERSSEPEMIKQSYVEYFKTLLTPNEKSQSVNIYTIS